MLLEEQVEFFDVLPGRVAQTVWTPFQQIGKGIRALLGLVVVGGHAEIPLDLGVLAFWISVHDSPRPSPASVGERGWEQEADQQTCEQRAARDEGGARDGDLPRRSG